MNPIEERPTGRLTIPNAIYCQEKCGQARFCQRFAQGNLCFNARCYDRLRQYEDTGLEPGEILKQKEKGR